MRTKPQAHSSATNEGHGAPVGAAVKALARPHNIPLAAPGDISFDPDLLPLPRRAPQGESRGPVPGPSAAPYNKDGAAALAALTFFPAQEARSVSVTWGGLRRTTKLLAVQRPGFAGGPRLLDG